ncbi:hypothetical protein ACTFIZ_011976 [Dictyostelium cf. discoideum]
MSINSKFSINDVLLNNESLQKKNKYLCLICSEFIYKKSIFQCKSGHYACKECWVKSLENKKECMICRLEVNSTNDLSRCLIIEQNFGKKQCCCIYSFNNYDFIDCANLIITLVKDEENGCKEIINIDQLDTHIENCQFKFVECSHNGCDIVLRLNSLDGHENQCGFKLVTCEYCGCDNIIQKELENHHRECPKFPIDCPQSCSNIIERDQIKSHIENDCNNSTIPCKYYEYGCKEEMKRSELQNHLNNVNHQYFMGLLIEKLSSSQEKLIKQYDQSKIFLEFLNSIKYKNKFIISEYSKKVDKFPNGTHLKYPSFHIDSNNFIKSQPIFNFKPNEFSILIYPNGNKSSSKGISIFLRGIRIERANIKVIFKLVNVLDKTKSKKSKFQKEIKNDDLIGRYINNGWPTFIESKLITQEDGWLSKDDKLTIKFKVKLFNNVIKPLEFIVVREDNELFHRYQIRSNHYRIQMVVQLKQQQIATISLIIYKQQVIIVSLQQPNRINNNENGGNEESDEPLLPGELQVIIASSIVDTDENGKYPLNGQVAGSYLCVKMIIPSHFNHKRVHHLPVCQ